MKSKNHIITSCLYLFCTFVLAQENSNCAHCTMAINDTKFKATALDHNNELLEFDAIECLINFQKKTPTIHTQKVTDYNSTVLVDATKAYYVKSEERPSPMGAYLSAYSNKEDALQVPFGSVMNWNALLNKFNDSSFGAVEHSHHNHHRADSHAPIGIMGDHLHPKGGFMLSLRVMHMHMKGNKIGNETIDDEEIYQNFMVAPQDMTMQMYMLGVMYAPSDKVTLMVMQHFARKEMNLTAQMMMPNGMPMKQNFETKSSGIGDVTVHALYSIWSSIGNSAHLNAGINLPIGEIDNTDDTPMMENSKLPYAMQLGAGTFDFTLGATIKGSKNNISWGIQQLNTIRTGRNSEEYRFGNLYKLNLWGAYSIIPQLSASLRLQGTSEGEISGSDRDLNPMMVPTAVTDNYGGEVLRSYIGINTMVAQNKLSIGAEAGLPMYQNFNGISMDSSFTINFGARFSI